MTFELTPHALRAMMSGATVHNPIVQILDVKKIATQGADRYRLILSDGSNFITAMLSQTANPRVASGEVAAFTVVQLTAFTLNNIQSRQVIIVLDVAPMGQAGGRIGSPVSLEKDASLAAGAGAGSAPAPAPVVVAGSMGGYGSSGAAAAAAAPHAGMPAAGGYGASAHAPAPGAGAYGAAPAAPGPAGGYRAPAAAGPAPGAYGAPAGGYRGGPTVSAGGGAHVVPISSLTTFTQRWTIRARVVAKGDIRTWNNARGSGKLFSVTLVDDSATEIRATFFQDAVDRFYELLQVGRVYTFGNGKVKMANMQFTNVRNDQEISFDDKAVIAPAQDDARIGRGVFNFVKVANLASVEANKVIDVCGVVASVNDPVDITSKAGKQLTKRDFTLADDTGASVGVTVWGEKARELHELEVGKVVALKGVKLGDYGGRSISTQHSTTYDFAPDHPEAHKVRGWWEAHKGAPPALRAMTERGGGGGGAGGEGPLSVLELRAPVKDLRADAGSGADGPLKVSKVTLTSIRRDDPSKLWYPACPGTTDAGRTCNKKMTATDSGAWTCASGCMAQAPTYRYIANATLVDATGQEFCTFFDTEAAQILGHPANEIQGMVAAAHGDAAGLPPDAEAIFAAVMYKELLLTTKAKLDDRGAEARVRVTVVKVREVDPAREAKVLINSLRQYAAATAAA